MMLSFSCFPTNMKKFRDVQIILLKRSILRLSWTSRMWENYLVWTSETWGKHLEHRKYGKTSGTWKKSKWSKIINLMLSHLLIKSC